MLELVWESPRSEAESVPLYDNVDVMIAVPEPEASSIDSSVTRPDVLPTVKVAVPVPVTVPVPVVVVLVSVVSVNLCVKDDEE